MFKKSYFEYFCCNITFVADAEAGYVYLTQLSPAVLHHTEDIPIVFTFEYNAYFKKQLILAFVEYVLDLNLYVFLDKKCICLSTS